MKRSIQTWILLVAIIAIASVAVGQDESPNQMIQKAKDGVRVATSHMQNGEREEAVKGVQAAAEILYKVRKIDPDNSKLGMVIWNAEELRDTLQKRMGKKIPLQTDPGAPAPGKVALPDDANALAQLAGDLLRKATSEMQNGRNAESKALLDQAAPAVAKLKKIKPNHPKMMALESDLRNQQATIDERLAGPAPLQTATTPTGGAVAPISVAAGTTTAPATQPAAAPPGKLPYHTRNIVDRIGKDFSGADRYFNDFAKGDLSLGEETMLNRIATRFQEVDESLPGLAEQAATDGVSNDPRVTAIPTELAAMKAKLAELRSGASTRAAAAEEAQGGKDGDVAALRATFERLDGPYFRKCTGSAIYYNDLEAPMATLVLIEEFEKTEQKPAQKQWNAFAAKYGSTREEVEKATGNGQAGYPFEGIRDGIANVAKTREAMADDLVENAESAIQGLPSLHDLYRVNGHDNARGYLNLAKRFSPENTSVKELDKTIDKTLKTDLEAYVKKIEDKTWPGNTNCKESKAGMTFFKEDIGWGQRDKNDRATDKAPRHPIGIAITGDWSVQEKNVRGQPTMYGIPALIAVQLDREKSMGLARVYSVTLRTAESANPEMKPPFKSITVGSSYFIKAKKVK